MALSWSGSNAGKGPAGTAPLGTHGLGFGKVGQQLVVVANHFALRAVERFSFSCSEVPSTMCTIREVST